MTSAVRRLAVGLPAVLVIAACVVAVSCSSLEKDALRAGLLALPKNAAAAQHGLEESALTLTADGEPVDVAVTFLHVTRRGTAPSGGTRAADAAPGALDAGAARHPVVLVHGTPGTLFTWTATIFGGEDDDGPFAGLADDFDVLAPDILGHGMTRGGPDAVTFQRCADMLAAWLEERALGPVHLVGQSYGGEFVWRAALDRPDLVASVTLVDSAGLARRDDEWLPEEWAMREYPGAHWGWVLNSRERIASALQPHFREPVDADRIEEMYLVCSNAENWRAMVDLARDENGTRQDELAELSRPTLLLWGAEDVAYTVERFARRFAERIPDARQVWLADCGHYPQEERPRAMIAALRTFLLDVEAAHAER